MLFTFVGLCDTEVLGMLEGLGVLFGFMGVGEEVITRLVGLSVKTSLGVSLGKLLDGLEGLGVTLGFFGVGEIEIVRLVGVSVIGVIDEGSGVFLGFAGVGENVIVRLVGIIVDTTLGISLGDSLCALEGFGDVSGFKVGTSEEMDGEGEFSKDGIEEGCKNEFMTFIGKKL